MTSHYNIFRLARRSLFLRLFFIFSLTALVLLIIVGIGSQRIWMSKTDNNFGQDYLTKQVLWIVDDLITEIGSPPNIPRAEEIVKDLPFGMVIRGRRMLWKSEGTLVNLRNVRVIKSIDKDTVLVRDRRLRGIKVRKNGFDYYMFWKGHLLNSDDFYIVYWSIALMLLVLFANYWFVRRLFKPIGLLKEGAERISEGDLSYRVESTRSDELGELTSSINSMADSLQGMLEAKQQLLLAISHEIRTPITRAKLQLEFIEDDDRKASLLEDINEVDVLVSELLEAERLNSQHSVINTEKIELCQLLKNIIDNNWADKSKINIDFPEHDLVIEADRFRINLMLRNLVNNALQYSSQSITVGVKALQGELVLSVTDFGQGIATEHIPYLTQPFYRGDTARQRKTGGYGLGLYLCHLIAVAHGGRLQIDSTLGEGTRVSVFFPLCP